jgi:hypothetical protein
MLLPVLRIRDVYSGSGFFPIPDPGSNKKKAGKNKIVVPVLVKNYLIFLHRYRKRFEPINSELKYF